MKKLIDVCVDLPVDGLFTYSVPEEYCDLIAEGMRVVVPFGKRTVTAYVCGIKKETDIKEVKPVVKLLDDKPIIDGNRLKFFKWAASYCVAPPAEVFKLSHPSFTNVKSKSVLVITEEGRRVLEKGDVVDSELLSTLKLSIKGINTNALKKEDNGILRQAAAKLKKLGFIEEQMQLGKGVSEKTTEYVRLVKSPTEGALKKAPLRKKIIEYLSGCGEIPITELRKEVKGSSGAFKKLVEDGFIIVEERVEEKSVLTGLKARESDFEANDEQKLAIEAIAEGLKDGKYAPFLLYGITGSGKTFVYLKAIEEALALGRRALMLVPEIALTGRASSFLAGRFPGRVAVLHSGLNEGERFSEWKKILDGKVDVVIGARSALFSPIPGLGLLIVDEEHDTSYKQSEGVRYNARDLSLMLAKMLGITVVLGSATPSLETFQNAKSGKIKLLTLKKRIDNAALPEIEICDMRKELKGEVLSVRLKALMQETLDKGEQTLLFLNRRGFSGFVQCRSCGKAFECVNCSVALTFHKGSKRLRCHYCDLSAPIPETCPECTSVDIVTRGIGTERVEEEVRALFPKARVARMDGDTTRKKGSLNSIVEAVEGGEVDVLIGTQMVSKGHHFPKVTLVGIISADTSLNIPDFRSAEQTYHIIAQAAGRAGREGHLSRVVVQTLNPAHASLTSVVNNDYEGFFAFEMEERDAAGYPPVKRLAIVRLEGAKLEAVEKAAALLSSAAKACGRGKNIECLGPVPALVEKVRGKIRRQMLFKAKDASLMNVFLTALKKKISEIPECRKVSFSFDVDPYSTA